MNTHLTNKTRVFFGVVVCLIYVFIISALIYNPIPEMNRGIIDVMFGSISTMMGMVFTFYFGSSEGSSKKTEALMNKINESTPLVRTEKEPYTQPKE